MRTFMCPVARLSIPAVLVAFIGAVMLGGCTAGEQPKKSSDFFTSGNREADQRADQRMAKAEQLKADGAGPKLLGPDNSKRPLYERLGGAAGLDAIVNDFVDRALADPRVNWERKDIKQGGFSFHRSRPVTEWTPNPQTVEALKKHMTQFLALATGGPVKYEGRQMTQVHGGLHISNAEFDASVGDMKATLDKLQVAAKEQKELLSVLESTRPQVVQDR